MRKKADPKLRLAEAFVEIASRQGVNRVTLEAVAKKARIPFSTAHYQLKQAGMGIVEFGLRSIGVDAQRYIETYLATETGRAGANPLREYFVGSYAWLRDFRPQANIWLFQYHLIAVNPELRRLHQPFLDAAVRRIEGLLFESIGKGHYPPWPNQAASATEVATAIHSLLMGTMTRALVSHVASPPGDALELHLDLALRAIPCLLELGPAASPGV